jgi:hypothetical protein
VNWIPVGGSVVVVQAVVAAELDGVEGGDADDEAPVAAGGTALPWPSIVWEQPHKESTASAQMIRTADLMCGIVLLDGPN